MYYTAVVVVVTDSIQGSSHYSSPSEPTFIFLWFNVVMIHRQYLAQSMVLLISDVFPSSSRLWY